MPSIALLLITVLVLSGCSRDAHDHPELTIGKQLFEHHCSECHNKSGIGKFLRGVPASKDTKLSASQISHKIRNDKDRRKMPIFDNMSNAEAQKIAAYLKRL
jgi:mono/diheme cytochrome c family protein